VGSKALLPKTAHGRTGAFRDGIEKPCRLVEKPHLFPGSSFVPVGGSGFAETFTDALLGSFSIDFCLYF